MVQAQQDNVMWAELVCHLKTVSFGGVAGCLMPLCTKLDSGLLTSKSKLCRDHKTWEKGI